MTYEISSNLRWFSRSNAGKQERKIFAEQGYCAVYVAGPDRALRLGWTGRDPRKIGEVPRVLAWCAGDLLAKRIVAAVSQMLAARLVGNRYDVPVNLAEQAIWIAAKKVGIQIFAHEAMMQQVKKIRQQRVEESLSKFEAQLRNAAQARELQRASTTQEDDLQIFDASPSLW